MVETAGTLGRAGKSMENTNHNAMHQHRHEGDAHRRIEVIKGNLRRRRWTAAEKSALVAESLQPGTNFSDLARQRSVSRSCCRPADGWRYVSRRNSVRSSFSFA